MEKFTIEKLGVIRCDEEGMRIVLEPKYAPALVGIEGFSHLNVLWWFSHCDTPANRSVLQEDSPYRQGPKVLGTFATRSPMRPNPIALSCGQVIWLDEENATIGLAWMDAEDGSPVLDIKPYTPSLDRVEKPASPQWCAHWPESIEASDGFDWGAEFNF